MAILQNLPSGRRAYLDQNGTPLAGALVYFYQPGTTNLAVVYQDDAQTAASPNPVPLDASGTLSVFGVGEFREYVVDADGNVISDSIVVGSTPLTVTEAMRPVLEAATPADAELILAGGEQSSFDNITVNGDQSLHVTPTANAPDTQASLTVQGAAVSPNSREFLVNMGLDTSVGHGVTGADKVTLYSGLTANSGTNDCWTLNTCLTMQANSGSYNAQGYELDFNNFNADRGATGTLQSDFSFPIAVGLSISGAGGFTSTAGLSIDSTAGGGKPQWARGAVTAGQFGICGYQEWSTCPVGLQFDGAYSIATINLTSVYGNAGAVSSTAMFMKNNQSLDWQTADTQNVATITVDTNNNMFIGLSSNNALQGVFLGATTVPHVDGTALGSTTNRWGDVWGRNLRMINSGALTWDSNPAVSGAPGFVSDFVTANNDRVVGSAARAVYIGASCNPLVTNSYDLGTPSNQWSTIYASGGISTPSDPTLKQNMKPMASMLDAVTAVEPIMFQWKHKPSATRHGFDASQVKQHLAGVCDEHDGISYLRKDDMFAVLWSAVRELASKLDALSVRVDGLGPSANKNALR